MKRYIRLTWLTIAYSFKSVASYRTAFVMNALAQIVSYLVDFGLTWIMVNAFGAMNGWTRYEVILLYAMSLASYALAGFFFFNIRQMSRDIRSGQFDDVLVKPMGALAYLICTRFNRGYVAHLALAIGLTVFCFGQMDVTLTVGKGLFFCLAVFCGALVYAGMFLIATIPAFFVVESRALGNLIFYFRQMSYYPLSIFPTVLQVALTVVIPYGMINFFPAQAVLDKADYLFLGPWIPILAPLIALLFFILSVLLFQIGIRHYKSSGS